MNQKMTQTTPQLQEIYAEQLSIQTNLVNSVILNKQINNTLKIRKSISQAKKKKGHKA